MSLSVPYNKLYTKRNKIRKINFIKIEVYKRDTKLNVIKEKFMTFSDFIPSNEYRKFEDQHGEDSFIKLNLLYLALEMNELNDENVTDDSFDELCEDVLEISLNEAFESYNIIDIADAVIFIIRDSNYTVAQYHARYKLKSDVICEELIAFIESCDEPVNDNYTE